MSSHIWTNLKKKCESILFNNCFNLDPFFRPLQFCVTNTMSGPGFISTSPALDSSIRPSHLLQLKTIFKFTIFTFTFLIRAFLRRFK